MSTPDKSEKCRDLQVLRSRIRELEADAARAWKLAQQAEDELNKALETIDNMQRSIRELEAPEVRAEKNGGKHG